MTENKFNINGGKGSHHGQQEMRKGRKSEMFDWKRRIKCTCRSKKNNNSSTEMR